MTKSAELLLPGDLYVSRIVPESAIQRYARRIAALFRPAKIILFGSYGYGSPTDDSDVDLLVVMPAKNFMEEAIRIRTTVRAPFAVDLIVRNPEFLQRSLRSGDSFIREIVTRGRVLYEAKNPPMAEKSRRRPARGSKHAARKTIPQ